MKIFVTGAAGFLGSHICEQLLKQGHEITGVDNLIGGSIENIPFLKNFIRADCCDLNAMYLSMLGHDVVYHCAATAHEGLSVFSPHLVTKNNYMATVGVVTAAIKAKVKRIIYCSSMARYGSQGTPFKEEMQPMPVDPYGISKVAGEEVLKCLCNTHNVEWVIAVPHNIIGPKQKYDDPFRNVVSIFLNRMLQNKPPIIYGNGKQVRCFSYIDDCLSALLKMVDAPSVVSQVINIGPDEEFVTIKEIADLCSNITKYNGAFVYTGERPREVKHAVCSSAKVRKLLDYKTTVPLKQAIEKTFAYIKEHGPREFKYYLDIEINNDKTPLTWKNQII